MSSSLQNPTMCPTCGARIETTGSGDFGCMACWLRTALEGPVDVPHNDAPESLGTYQIGRHEDGSAWTLGQGAMGVTYRARDVSLQREVALKLISSQYCQLGAEARGRFVREARAAASLHHPNVATVYQFGIDEESGQCYCAMELVEGETLDERVRRSGPLAVPLVLEIARQIVSALMVAEKHGIVHRDLKPGNVMITTGDEPDRIAVKIIDFGLAKALGATADPRVLTDGGFLGTPAFASPEQLARSAVDVRSDIYSLGATLWYLLTGHLPVGNGSSSARLPATQLRAAHVPPAFSSLLFAMLATEPAARPTAKEIAARLAPKPRRHVWVAVMAGAALLIVALSLALYFHAPRPAPDANVAFTRHTSQGRCRSSLRKFERRKRKHQLRRRRAGRIADRPRAYRRAEGGEPDERAAIPPRPAPQPARDRPAAWRGLHCGRSHPEESRAGAD